jgi:ribosome recycling factor
MKLELTQEDRELLVRILERTIGDTRVEVRRTRAPAMHDELIADEKRMKALVEQLRSADA